MIWVVLDPCWVFLMCGYTIASFMHWVKVPLWRDKLQRWQITGTIKGTSFFKSQVGMGSNGHEVADTYINSDWISLSVTVSKCDKTVTLCGCMVGCRLPNGGDLITKKVAKSWAVSLAVGDCWGGSVSCLIYTEHAGYCDSCQWSSKRTTCIWLQTVDAEIDTGYDRLS